MSGNTVGRETAPAIERIQHNVADAEWEFAAEPGVDVEYAEDFEHRGPSVRLVLANGNCIEYHRLDAETLVECAFVALERGGERELLLENTHKTRRADVADTATFLGTVAESVAVYRRDIDTVADAEELWHNIVPALGG
jgi:hypothetical protein